MESVQKQLEELGLSQHEVKAYLAALELGPATVLQISAKSTVQRGTAHTAVGSLVKRGLMSSHTRGKKQFYQAERPGQLMRLVEEEKKQLADRESKLKSLLPGLEAMIAMAGEKPEVKYYEGWEGLETLQSKLLHSGIKNFEVITYHAVATARYNRLPAEKTINYALELQKKGIGMREIIIGPIALVKNWRPFVNNKKCQYKILPNKSAESGGEIAIFGNSITLTAYLDKPYSCIISNKDLAGLVRVMFDAIWHSPKVKNLHVR